MKCNEPVKLFMKIDLTSEYFDSRVKKTQMPPLS